MSGGHRNMTETPHKPNLFIIGAMKSGTTSLHEYLHTHPQIAMSHMKEPGYFVEELTLHKGEEWYLSLFDRSDSYRYIGESSTHYTKLPVYQGVPERIFRFNRDARLVYIMRNPFDRIVSHFWHAVRDLYHGGELRSLLKAVQERPEYLAYSDYATQLEPYFERFGKDSVLTLTFESMIDDPQRELDRIYLWLGLAPHPVGERLGRARNQKPKDMMGIAGVGVLNRIQYSRAWDQISPHVPSWLKNWAKERAYRPVDERQSHADIVRLREAVGELQRRQIDRLSRLLNREFPEWGVQTRSSASLQTAGM
jgi:Sulfotransferase domain